MPVQDLTPQLRTRLSRLERLVGLFVTVATILLLAGLAYYVYKTAERKGWFVSKARYFTYLQTAAGLKIGDMVRLMGFDAGQITKIIPENPGTPYNVYIEFDLKFPHYGYIWDDSRVKVKGSGFLGNRFLEVTKGTTNAIHSSYKHKDGKLTHVYLDKEGYYTNYTKTAAPYWLLADEPPELTDQLDQVVQMAKGALPNILTLTNLLTKVLTNTASATMHLNDLLSAARPAVSNFATISSNLVEPKGSLGEWVLPTNVHHQLSLLLTNANTTVTNVNTNLVVLVQNLNNSLENLAEITGNLNTQVQGNTNLVSSVSSVITNADNLMQGLKRHWLLRSAFKDKPKPPSRR